MVDALRRSQSNLHQIIFFLSIIKLRQRNNPRDYLTKLWLLDGLEQARSKDEKKAQFLSPLHSSKAYWRKKVVLVA